MNFVEKLLLAKSREYANWRAELRGQARDYAESIVGTSKARGNARTALARAYDAGVSASVAGIRDALAKEASAWGLTAEEWRTIEALRNGDAAVIATPNVRSRTSEVGGSAVGADGSREARTVPVRGATETGELREGVAAVARETERDENELSPDETVGWAVGDRCVWTDRPELGAATIKWIGSKDLASHSFLTGRTKRCKLYYDVLDRTEDAMLDELAPVGTV